MNLVNGKQAGVTPKQLAMGHTGHLRSQVTQWDSANPETTSVSSSGSTGPQPWPQPCGRCHRGDRNSLFSHIKNIIKILAGRY